MLSVPVYALEKLYAAVKELVDNGELGDVYFSDIEFIRRIGIPTWGNVPYEKAQFRRPVLRSRRTSDMIRCCEIVGDKR